MPTDQEMEALKLDNQLCFPLYAAAKEVVRRYKPFLDEIDLTYTQYITMMVLWEQHSINVKALGEHLYLDSGTLTPLLKKLEAKGYVKRTRSEHDERNVLIEITPAGDQLAERAKYIPAKMGGCIPLSSDEAVTLYQLLYRIIGSLTSSPCTRKESN